MKYSFSILALILSAAAMSSSVAGELSYDHVSLGYTEIAIDGSASDDYEIDGFNAGFSVSFDDNWYMSLNSYMTRDTVFDIDLELDLHTANFGFHTPVSNNIDFISELGFARVATKYDSVGFSASDSESSANILAGFKGILNEQFEWNVNAQYMDFDESMTFFNAEIRYLFNQQLSLGLKGSFEDYVNIYSLSLRYSF